MLAVAEFVDVDGAHNKELYLEDSQGFTWEDGGDGGDFEVGHGGGAVCVLDCTCFDFCEGIVVCTAGGGVMDVVGGVRSSIESVGGVFGDVDGRAVETDVVLSCDL